MALLKLFCPMESGPGVHVLLERNYDNRFSKIQALVAEARRTYPRLRSDQITVVQFGGDRYRNMYGIEFKVKGVTEPPEGYDLISELPLIASPPVDPPTNTQLAS